jgi:hypothetical protein
VAIDINDLRATLGEQLIEALKFKNQLTLAQRVIAERDAEIATLKAQLGAMTPEGPSGDLDPTEQGYANLAAQQGRHAQKLAERRGVAA